MTREPHYKQLDYRQREAEASVWINGLIADTANAAR
jgi:hypothetical protein